MDINRPSNPGVILEKGSIIIRVSGIISNLVFSVLELSSAE